MDTWTQIQNLQIHYTGNNYILWIHIVLTTEDSWRLEYHRRICFSVLFYTEKNNAFFFLKKSINHTTHLTYKQTIKASYLPANLVDSLYVLLNILLSQLVQKV